MKKRIIYLFVVLLICSLCTTSLAIDVKNEDTDYNILNSEKIKEEDSNKIESKSNQDKVIEEKKDKNETEDNNKKREILVENDKEQEKSKVINEEEKTNKQVLEDGVYEICSRSNNKKAISSINNSYSNYTNIYLETSKNLKRQKFKIRYDKTNEAYFIEALHGNKALDVNGGKKEDETNVQLYDFNGSLAQQWEIKELEDNTYTIISKNSNKCLDIKWGIIQDGSNIQIYEAYNSNNQKFVFNKVKEQLECEDIIEEGEYFICSALSKNKAISINNGEYGNLANVNLWDKNNKEYQKFKFVYDEKNKCYTITVAHSEKALDVYWALQDNYTNIEQYESNNTDAQKWIIEKTDDGYYSFISKCNELYLDVDGARKENGTNVQTYEGNGTLAQKFKLEKAEANIGEKTIENGVYNIVPKSNNSKVIEMEAQTTANGGKIQIARKLSVINKSQNFEVEYLNNGYYAIKALKAEKTLEVENGAHTNGTKVQQNTDGFYTTQQWIIKDAGDGYYYLISRCNGLYLDVPGGNAIDGAKLQMYEGNSSNAQKFKFEEPNNIINNEKTIEDGCYVIRTKLNRNKVLDVSEGSYNNCANVQIWNQDTVQQQKFQVKYNDDGKYYEIQSVNSGKNLDVWGNGTTDCTNVIQYEKNNTIAQRWIIQKADNESYYIVAMNSYLYLDVNGSRTSNGTNVHIYEGSEGNNQKFIFEPIQTLEENEYKVISRTDSNKCLDISEGSTEENANLQIWSLDNVNQQLFRVENVNPRYCKLVAKHSDKALTVTNNNNVVQTTYNNNDNQHWIIEPVGEGFYKIKSKSTGLYLDIDSNRTANGTNVQVYEGNNTTAQIFKFEILTIKRGIDVSAYNGSINWQIVRMFGNIDYAIIRAGYRGYRYERLVQDAYFAENVQGAKENNIDIGLYFYTQAVNVSEAIEEANYVVGLARQYNLQLKYPIYIDTERSTAAADNPGRADNLDRYTRTEIMKAFCNTIRNNGYIPGIYASKYWFYYNLEVAQLNEYDIWVAHYTGDENNPTDYKYKYDMWQYTSSGYVPGVDTVVDRNICFKMY